jgi:hypothetical protein
MVTVGGLTEPFPRIVKRAGTRTLMEPVGVLPVALVVDVVVVFGGAVGVVVVVVVAGGGTVAVVVDVDDVEVDFEPPHDTTSAAPKRIASPLTFAG